MQIFLKFFFTHFPAGRFAADTISAAVRYRLYSSIGKILSRKSVKVSFLWKNKASAKALFPLHWLCHSLFFSLTFPMHHFPVIPLLSLLLFPSDTYPE